MFCSRALPTVCLYPIVSLQHLLLIVYISHRIIHSHAVSLFLHPCDGKSALDWWQSTDGLTMSPHPLASKPPSSCEPWAPKPTVCLTLASLCQRFLWRLLFGYPCPTCASSLYSSPIAAPSDTPCPTLQFAIPSVKPAARKWNHGLNAIRASWWRCVYVRPSLPHHSSSSPPRPTPAIERHKSCT